MKTKKVELADISRFHGDYELKQGSMKGFYILPGDFVCKYSLTEQKAGAKYAVRGSISLLDPQTGSTMKTRRTARKATRISDAERFVEELIPAKSTMTAIRSTVYSHSKDGQELRQKIAACAMDLYIGIAGEENGVPEGKIYFYVFDIQNQKDRMEGRCSVMYSKDTRNALTGLRVREVFMPLAIELSGSGPGPRCCLVIDIQHFKIFNSWFGYETGDYLLSRIGQYLLNLERNEEAVAAYFGHDHFALMLRHDTDRIRAIYRDIQEIVNSYSRMVGFLPAFGVYLLEDEAQPGLDIYDKAKLAVEEAKKATRIGSSTLIRRNTAEPGKITSC